MPSIFQGLVGSRQLTLEAGKLAQQANGSVVIRYGDCVALATATMALPREGGRDFFPLTIDFEERMYARGKIPGSFFRREGRPGTDAILTDRLTDRPLRPLFPKDFRNEVQIVITSLSADLENPLDLLAINGASAALCISDIPFGGPIAATRIGYIDGDFVINPTYEELDVSQLDLVAASTREGVLMLEAGANRLPDDVILEAIRRGHGANQEVISIQDEMIKSVGKAKIEFSGNGYPKDLRGKLSTLIGNRLKQVLDVPGDKVDQGSRLATLKEEVSEELVDAFEPGHITQAYEGLVDSEFRARIVDNGIRPDGRDLDEIRVLSSEVGILPRTHGSGLFSRGETQVLGIATLGSVGDVQKLDGLSPQESKRFMFHYNFPPYSTGEAGRVGSPKRRDIGHGALAERALLPVLPSPEDFPYTIRLVAEVLSSNGSTSMASACAGTLALMDAGVPIDAPVAGISVGLITDEDGGFVTLTDIQGMEDHVGDMDFKVAGTEDGITAIQLDIKIQNIGFDVIEAALAQAKRARLTILQEMTETISVPRTELSQYAPRVTTINIPVDKIGAVIGPGGKMIRSIVEETKATIDVQDDGTVLISSTDKSATLKAINIIENLTKEAKVGDIYTGKVVRTLDFGAFVEILPGKDGMVHISELSDGHVPTVEDVVKVGDEITVVVIGVDQSGRVALSRRALLEDSESTGDDSSSQTEKSQSPSGGPTGEMRGGRRGGNDRARGEDRSSGGGWKDRPHGGGRGSRSGNR